MSQYDAVVKGRKRSENERWLCMEFSTDSLNFLKVTGETFLFSPNLACKSLTVPW